MIKLQMSWIQIILWAVVLAFLTILLALVVQAMLRANVWITFILLLIFFLIFLPLSGTFLKFFQTTFPEMFESWGISGSGQKPV
jgi:hypothetical protein